MRAEVERVLLARDEQNLKTQLTMEIGGVSESAKSRSGKKGRGKRKEKSEGAAAEEATGAITWTRRGRSPREATVEEWRQRRDQGVSILEQAGSC